MASRARLQDQVALGEHQLDVDLGRDLDLRVVPPGGVRVGPGLDPERPGALGVGSRRRLVAVGKSSSVMYDERAVLAFRVGEHDAGARAGRVPRGTRPPRP